MGCNSKWSPNRSVNIVKPRFWFYSKQEKWELPGAKKPQVYCAAILYGHLIICSFVLLDYALLQHIYWHDKVLKVGPALSPDVDTGPQGLVLNVVERPLFQSLCCQGAYS